jgi:hypothetical protein
MTQRAQNFRDLAKAYKELADLAKEGQRQCERAAIDAALEGGAVPKVKALEWVQNSALLASATGPFGNSYTLMKDFTGRGWFCHETGVDYRTLEAAKAAAQADYERRILSALDLPSPPTGA